MKNWVINCSIAGCILLQSGRVICQKTDTTFYHDKHIQTLTRHKDSLDRLTNTTVKIWEIHSFYDDGKVLSNALCVFRNSALSPVKETSVFFEDGKLKEYCNPDKGELKKFNPNGELIYLLIEKPGDTVQTETEYYYNRNIKKIRKEQKRKNELLVNYYPGTQNLPEMHQVMHYGFISEKTYFPNGKIFSESQNKKVNGIETMSTIYYTRDGKTDTSSALKAVFNGKYFNNYSKEGRRLEFYNNGNLKSDEYYKNNALTGTNTYHYENGELQKRQAFLPGRMDVFMYNEDGSLQSETHYKGSQTDGPEVRFGRAGKLEYIGSDNTYIPHFSFKFDTLGNITNARLPIRNNNKLQFIDKGGMGNFIVNVKGPKNNPEAIEFLYSDRSKFFTIHIDSLKFNGPAVFYDMTGQVILKGNYTYGYLNGDYLLMDGTDTLESCKIKMGQLTGLYVRHNFTTHKLYDVSLYDDSGKFVMSQQQYDNAGNLQSKNEFDNKNNIIQTLYFPSGKVNSISYAYNGAHYNYKVQKYFEISQLKEEITAEMADDKVTQKGKEYYDNGKLKTKYTRVDNVTTGDYTEYYSNGNLKRKAHYMSGAREGIFTSYNEQGQEISREKYKNDRLDKSDITEINKKDSCFCNFSSNTKYGFLNPLSSFVKFGNFTLKGFYILDSTINKAFFEYSNSYDGALSGNIVTYQKLLVHIPHNKNCILNFTPCYRTKDQYKVNINTRQDKLGDVFIQLDDPVFSVDVPKEVLQPVNEKGIALKDSNNSDFIFTGKEMTYTNSPYENVQISGLEPKYFCRHWFKLGNSEVFILPDYYLIDLDSATIPQYTITEQNPERRYSEQMFYYANYPFHTKTIMASDIGREYIPDNFLSGYVGLIIKTGDVMIKTSSKNKLQGKLADILIGSSEVTGLFIFQRKDFLKDYTTENLKNDFTSMGYLVQIEDTPKITPYDEIKIYFSYPLK